VVVTEDSDTATDPPASPSAWTAFETAYDGWQSLLFLVVGHEAGTLAALLQGPATAVELAARAGSDPRMTLEWLRVMTVTGYVDVDDTGTVFAARPGLDEIHDVPGVDTPAGVVGAILRTVPDVLDALSTALRSGGGVDPSIYGTGSTRLQNLSSLTTGPRHLVPDVLAPVHGLVELLTAGCRVVEIGCGGGWALETMADAFPACGLVGHDLDEHALGLARQRLARFGDRCRVERRDIADLAPGSADVVLAIDLVHDLADPAGSVAWVRTVLAPGGVFVMTETDASGDFSVDRHTPQAWQYGPSFARCIPMAQHAGGTGLGSMWGRAAAVALLRDAGFTDVTVHRTDQGSAVFAARP
jgi:SAM-dependent methyltransferase